MQQNRSLKFSLLFDQPFSFFSILASQVKERKRLGQWLIVGAFLVIAMISGLFLSSRIINPELFSRDAEAFAFANIENEFALAMGAMANLTANSTDFENKIMAYFDFVENYGLSRSITIQEFALLGQPTDEGLNVTIANYYGVGIHNMSLNINGVSIEIEHIDSRDSKTLQFLDTNAQYNLSYSLTIVENGKKEKITNNAFFDRRLFGILHAKISAIDYTRKETIIN